MRQPRPGRFALNNLLASAALALAPHLQQLPRWVVLVCVAAFAWRFAIEHYNWPAPGRLLRVSLTVLLVAATLKHYHTLLGRDAGSALLAVLLALKLLELGRLRDCIVTVLLCYLLLVTSFLYSQSLALALYSLLVVLATIATLISLNQPTLGGLRRQLRLAGLLVAKALPLMFAMFILFPRVHGHLWGLTADTQSGFTGLSEVMQPGSLQRLTTSDAPAFRVSFEGEPPRTAQLYWRALVLWHSDGKRWTRGEPSVASVPDKPFERFGAPVKYVVTLEPSSKPWMVALDLPVTTPARAQTRVGHVLEYSAPVRERLNYTLVSYPRYRTGALDPREREQALQLPSNVSARVRALTQVWRETASDNLAIAEAALRYFRNEPFYYTLQPPLLGADPVDEFLFSTRRGFCGHFASAFVTLMRAAGVPSRIVQGYLGGEYNPAGDYWMVRQADAHAWAEVWAPERGWVRVDPTAAVAPERVELGIDAVRRLELSGVELGRLPTEAVRRLIELGWFAGTWRTARFYWDATTLSWHRWVLGYNDERQRRLLDSLRLPQLSPQGLLLMLALVLLCGLLALATFTRRVRKRDGVQVLYHAFCKKLARIGIQRAPAEGALTFAQRACALRPDLRPAVEAVTGVYVQLRYAPASDVAHMHTLKRLVAKFRPSLTRA